MSQKPPSPKGAAPENPFGPVGDEVFAEETFPTLPSIEIIQAASLDDIGEDDFTISEASKPEASQRQPTVDPSTFVVAGELARGGLGRILKARDLRLGRTVAIKEVIKGNDRVRARLIREALITARLQHPSIIPVYEAGRWPSGEPFFTMKLVSGRPLDQVIYETQTFEGRLALLPHLINVAEAIAYAHSKKIIHRDLKPANILLGEFGETVVIDWGLAKNLSDQKPEPEFAQRLTAVGAVVGTPAFMPPEQAAAMPLDERADVYSLGALLYCLLSGAPPYSGKTPGVILGKVLQAPPVPLEARQPEVPRELARIVARAMARKPEDRYPTAKELVEDLKRFQTSQLTGAEGTRKKPWTLWQWLGLLLLLCTLGALGLGGFLVAKRVQGTLADAREEALAEKNARQTLEESLRSEEEARKQAAQELKDTRARLARLFLQKGQEELLTGDPGRALLLLGEAYRLDSEDPRVRFLIRRALHPEEGHVAPVVHLAFSPDASRAVTASVDGTAKVWDTATQKAIHTLKGHSDGVLWADFNPDGTRIVTASADATARVWSASSGKLFLVLKGHSDQVLRASFSADNERIVTTSLDRTAKLWRASRGTLLAILGGEDYPIQSAAFSSDSAVLFTRGEDGTIKFWDAQNGKFLSSYEGQPDSIKSLRPTAEGEAPNLPPEEIFKNISCYLPWSLEGGAFVPVRPDPDNCR